MASSSSTAHSTFRSSKQTRRTFLELGDMGALVCESTGSICRRAVHAGAWSEDREVTVYRSPDSRQGVIGLIFGDEEMVVDIWNKLDDDSKRNIIARLPFRSLFRATSLSQAWRDSFRSDKRFQSEVNSSAASWKYYFPLLVNRMGNTVGYDSSSRHWQRLPTHSYPPRAVVQGRRSLIAVHGSLLCWSSSAVGVHVTNPLTNTWKQLPTRQDKPKLVHVNCEGREAYKVILGSWERSMDQMTMSLEMFDSTDNSWSEKSRHTQWNHAKFGGSAVLNGVLYMIFWGLFPEIVARELGWKVVSFDLKETWKEAYYVDKYMCRRHFDDYQFLELFVRGSDLMQVRGCRKIEVFRLDVVDGWTLMVRINLPKYWKEKLPVDDIYFVAGYGDLIYMGGRFPCSLSILYNIRTKEWHPISSPLDSLLRFGGDLVQWSWTKVAYQPGLNPFLEV